MASESTDTITPEADIYFFFFSENAAIKGEKSICLYMMLIVTWIICHSLGQTISELEQEGE